MRQFFACVFFLFSQSAAPAETLQGTVSRVSDGDTLQVTVNSSRKPIKLRIQGIDAPEICQSGGKASRDALRTRLLRQNVIFTTQARDQFGRAIARIEHRGEDVGQWLVGSGYAWSDGYRNNLGPYGKEQVAAQKKGVGLWADRAAIGPGQWRKIHGACPYPK